MLLGTTQFAQNVFSDVSDILLSRCRTNDFELVPTGNSFWMSRKVHEGKPGSTWNKSPEVDWKMNRKHVKWQSLDFQNTSDIFGYLRILMDSERFWTYPTYSQHSTSLCAAHSSGLVCGCLKHHTEIHGAWIGAAETSQRLAFLLQSIGKIGDDQMAKWPNSNISKLDYCTFGSLSHSKHLLVSYMYICISMYI